MSKRMSLKARVEEIEAELAEMRSLLNDIDSDLDCGKGLVDGLPDIAWCDIPAGGFLMGSSDDDKDAYSDEKPQRTVQLGDYQIGKYPVTNAQYRAFVESDKYDTLYYWIEAIEDKVFDRLVLQRGPTAFESWEDRISNAGSPFDEPDHPVVCVTWYEAMAFCRWLTERLKETGDLGEDEEITLPSEAEWEKAARGTDGRIYPWGNKFNQALCNCNGESTTPVGSYSPQGDSPYGCADMAGNVWEWTKSEYIP